MSNALDKWFDRKQITPFRAFSQLQDPFDRMWNEFMTLRKTNDMDMIGFSPSCEIFEEGNNYVLTFDLPGVKKDQVSVEAANDQLTVRAERKEEKRTGEKGTEEKKKHLSEVYYGAYSRTFTLPGSIDEKKIDARFDNGVLTVTVPKVESAKIKQIPVH